MYISENSLDDVLRIVIARLLRSTIRVNASRGATQELNGVLVEIKNPRSRLSRTEKKGTVFSCLGELLWYLAGSNDLSFIAYYINRYTEESEDGRTVYGAYGPRIFGANEFAQFHNALQLLREKPTSRRAAIQIFDRQDTFRSHVEIPCTCTIQLLIRNDRLNMVTYMRSNDAFKGLPHDVFAFTMLQELAARSLSVELGTYKHAVGSMHIYDENIEGAQQFLNEGWQENIAMPAMPKGDPWGAVSQLLEAERNIREKADYEDSALEPYWQDLIRLLRIYRAGKDRQLRELIRLSRDMHSNVYDTYIGRRRRRLEVEKGPQQLDLISNDGTPTREK